MPIPKRELLGTKYVLLFLKCCAFGDYTEKKRDEIQTEVGLTGGSLFLEVYQDPMKYPIKEKRSLHSQSRFEVSRIIPTETCCSTRLIS